MEKDIVREIIYIDEKEYQKIKMLLNRENNYFNEEELNRITLKLR